ncbi:MAG: aldehyde ferredoxin oxidoreductase family protein [Bacteroidota bacterium]
MKEIIGTGNKVLEVDLSKEEYKVYDVTKEERRMYLGGKGLGLKLIYDRIPPGTDPLGEDNIIAFMPGVLMGTGAPCTGRFEAITKSPLTGIMATASCGGPFGMNLKTAGWDGILIRGTAKSPVYLEVTSHGVEFKSAAGIWGEDSTSAQSMLGNKGGVAVIGPAGENLVRFANIVSGTRFVGRTGMGAVMGSKMLKAILAIGGEYKIVPVEKDRFKKLKKTATKYINSNYMSILYRNFGTPANVNLSNAGGILPINNFTKGMSGEAYKISGEDVKEKFDTKHHPCKPCTILCGKKGNFDGKEMIAPEYETVGLLGANIGVFDTIIIAKWNEICGELGMDTISAGNTIGWVMEATEKGLVKSDLKFGSPGGVAGILKDIAYGNGLGKDIALGTRSLSEKYGGKDFAIHVKGLEIAAYDPRGSFGLGLSYAVANRGGCHLSTSLFVMEVFLSLMNPYSTRGKADFVKFLEDLYCCINSSQTCLFTAFAYLLEAPLTKITPKFILQFLMRNLTKVAIMVTDFSLYTNLWSTVTGIKISNSDFVKAGERIHVLERYMNTREGISRKDDTLPGRFLTEGRECDPKKRTVPLDKMLNKYYKIRGFDNNGIPTRKLMNKLGIEIK